MKKMWSMRMTECCSAIKGKEGYHRDKLQKHYSVSVKDPRLCDSIHPRCPKLVNPQNQKADW